MVVFKISIFLISLVCFSYRNISLINMTFPRMSLSKNWQSDRSSLPEVFCKRCVLRNFAIFTGKHLCQSLCNFVKQETLAQVFSCEFCEISKNTFFHRTPLVAASGQNRTLFAAPCIPVLELKMGSSWKRMLCKKTVLKILSQT